MRTHITLRVLLMCFRVLSLLVIKTAGSSTVLKQWQTLYVIIVGQLMLPKKLQKAK